MNSRNILVLAPNADEYLPLLEELADSGAVIRAASSVQATLESGTGQTVILGQPDLVVDLLEKSPEVAWIQSTWAGVAPLIALGRRDYLLTGIKNTFGAQISEYVLGYLLAFELDLLERLGRQANRSWWPEPTGTLAGKTLGILGTGSIGRHIAGMSGPFGVSVLGLSRSGNPVDGFERVYPVERLREFLKVLDYLVCTLPETGATTGLLDEATFAAIKPGCYLVNVGRGSIFEEDALLSALEKGVLAGVVLDVFRDEPLALNSPLWHARNLLVTAHVAAKSWPEDIAALFVENYRRYIRGEKLKYLVDFDRGY
jgi:phosphoglycerate dehydrogenase-like enzyme